MGSVHGPRLAWPRRGHRGAAVLAVAVLAALTAVSGAQRAAYGATEGPYGGTPAAVPGTVQAANYDGGSRIGIMDNFSDMAAIFDGKSSFYTNFPAKLIMVSG